MPEPPDKVDELRRQVAELQLRLELVQEFCAAGIFERDPLTMQGRWDEHLYRVFGLPVPPPDAPAPPYEQVRSMMLTEGRKVGRYQATMSQPGVHADRLRIRRPDGSIRHLHSQWKVLTDEQGRPARVLGVNTDVTEVWEIARRAQTLREELDLVLRLGGIGLWRADLKSKRVQMDDESSRYFGVAPREQGYLLDEMRAMIHPDDIDTVIASAEHTLRTGLPSDMSLRLKRPGGGWMHVLSRRTLLRDDDGTPRAFLGVMLDETARVAEAREAQQALQRLESAAAAARIGLWSQSDDDQAPDWNRRMFELFGLDPKQRALSIDEWIECCVHPDDRRRAADRLAPWARSGIGPLEIELRIVRIGDAALRWLVLSGDVRPAGVDEPRRVQGIAIDVSEQRAASRQLRDAAERVAFTASVVGLGCWEHEAGQNHGVWDEGMFRLRGQQSARRSVDFDEMSTYLHPEDRLTLMAAQLARLASGNEWRFDFRVVWPDGTVRWLASRSAAVRDEDGRLRRIGLNWDITESVQAEQVRREREVAVAESRAKSRFLSRVSHELRTPLNAVLGFAQLMRDERADSDPTLRRRWLEHIDDAGRHLLALIEDVLDLSRMDSGDMRLALQPVPLAPLVRATLALVEREALGRQVALECDPRLDSVVLADPVRLRQVLLNLLSNAVKYNRRGGIVRVGSRIDVDEVTLQVSDTGSGIDESALQHAFEPFNRLGAENRGIEGTGIGLAISKALVEHMGGRIVVESRPGQGSVFSVVLARAAVPLPDADSRPATAAAAVVPPLMAHGRSRVLYIEDNPVNALLVHEMLAPLPWLELQTAADGREGIERARSGQPALILLDMQLPDLEGAEVMRRLRTDPLTALIPCVALSANAMAVDIDAALAAGVLEYWTKPVDHNRLVADLTRLLRRAPPTAGST